MVEESKDTISVKELILQFKSWVRFVSSRWLMILIIGIAGAIIGYFYSNQLKPTYTGKLTFVLATETKGNGLSGLASQFGLDIGSTGSDAFSGQNIVGLMTSQKILHKVFFKTIPEVKDNLANLIANEIGYAEVWKNNPRFQQLFPFPIDETKLLPLQDSLLRELYDVVTTNYLKVAKPEKNEFFYAVTTTSFNELIAANLPKFIVDETAQFYINTKTMQARKNLELLQYEADSLRGKLSGSISATSNIMDKTFNLNPALQRQRNQVLEGQVKTNIVSAAYAEVLKNLEIAKINLQRDMPLYQVIDTPEKPLKIKLVSHKKFLILGFVIGSLFIITLLVLRKLFHEVMK